MGKIKILDLDSKLFGFKVGKLTGKRLNLKKAEAVVRACKREDIRCLYMDFEFDYETFAIAAKKGFFLADVKIRLKKDLRFSPKNDLTGIAGYHVDDAVSCEDINRLVGLAKEISKVSRFSFDNKFPEGSGERMYSIWMKNSIKKIAADKVFVARSLRTNRPAGVLTCGKKQGVGNIVLMGVNKAHNGRGLASLLLAKVCAYFRSIGINTVEVVTQAANIPALRLYQKNGFVIANISAIYHLWLD